MLSKDCSTKLGLLGTPALFIFSYNFYVKFKFENSISTLEIKVSLNYELISLSYFVLIIIQTH